MKDFTGPERNFQRVSWFLCVFKKSSQCWHKRV